MHTKRIIPCLDIKDGRTVKGVNFIGLRDAGDPVELAQRYAQEGADELVFLDISATQEKRKTLLGLVTRIAQQINIPFTVGGGITSVEEIGEILKAGADKVSLNSSIVKNPALVTEAASRFGSQAIVAAVDAKRVENSWRVFVKGGTEDTGRNVVEWVQEVADRGAGEILLTSMDRDGTKSGFDLELLKEVNRQVSVPVIASGGAGSIDHCIEAITKGLADAVLAASIFHFREIEIADLKQEMSRAGIAVRTIDRELMFLYELESQLKSRKRELPEDSYTAHLFRKGIDKIAQKVGEEAVEVVIASKNSDDTETIYESADLIYHLLVLLAEKDIPLDHVIQELKSRSK